ncbi:MAG: lipid II flippase MurJ [Mycobacteriales bacterium]
MTSEATSPRSASTTGAALGRTAASIAVVLLAARFVGILRVFTQASVLGPALGDAYVTANKIPNIVFDVVAGGALSSVVIPVLARPIAERDDTGTRRNASALLTWTILILLPLSLVGMALSRPIITVLLSGVGDDVLRQQKINVGSRLLVVFMPQLVLYGVGVVLTGVLQAHRRFLAPAFAPLLSSLVVIGAYLTYSAQSGGNRSIADITRGEELILSLGTTLGVAALTLPLLLPASRLGLRLRPSLRMTEGAGRQIRRLALAGAITLGAQQLTTGVVVVLANRVVGGLIVYELAWTVFMVPWAILAVPIATSVFPDLTESAAVGDEQRYAGALASALRAIAMTMLLAAAVLAALSRPLAQLLLTLMQPEAGGAGAADLARAIAAFAPGLVGYGAIALLTRAAYARHAGKAAAMATAAGFAVAALVDVALASAVSRHWLVAAMGIGNTVGMTVAAVALVWWLRGAAGQAATAGALRVAIVGSLGAFVAAPLGMLVADWANADGATGALRAAVVSAAVAAGLFAAVAAAGLREEFGALLRRLRGTVPRRG